MSVRFRFRRLWPSGITGRLIAIFAVAIALTIGVSELVEWHHYSHWEEMDLHAQDRQRMIAIASFLQSSKDLTDGKLQQALNGPLLELKPSLAPQAGSQQHTTSLDKFRQELDQALTVPFSVQLQQSSRQYWLDYQQGRTVLWPSRRRLVVRVRDHQGQWWQITMPQYGVDKPRFQGRKWLLILLAGMTLWFGFSWIARRMTRPILQFAAAADRLGLDMNAPPLPEKGSRELREAAQAFNRMQARLQQLIADRTLMLAAISHDLRTILTRLRLRTEYINHETQQLKAQADLEQMEAMLAATITFAKEESTPEAHTVLDLRSLIQSVCDDLSDAGYMVELVDGTAPQITGQPLALRRAFSNLIENGAIYGQKVTVSISETEHGIEIAIADQGPGIPDEMQEKVFQPFFRLEPSRNRDTGGTGLGLSVVHTIIQRHQGKIEFQYVKPRGFIVKVIL